MCLAPKWKDAMCSKEPNPDAWTIGGQEYDLKDFAANHPGGSHAVWLSQGLDSTALFLSYHPADYVKRLRPYAVGEPAPNAPVSLAADPLLTDLRLRVSKAFGKPLRELKTPMWGWAVNAALVAVYASLWYAWATMPSLLIAAAFGLSGFFVAGFIQHEGSHFSLSKKVWVNNIGRYMLLPWGDPAEWFRAHTCTHHPYTNTDLDPDFQHEDPLVRHHPDAPHSWSHYMMVFILVIYGPLLPFFYSIDGRAAGSAFKRAIKLRNSGWTAMESRAYLLLTPAMFYSHYLAHGSVVLALLPVSAFGLVFLWITQLSHIQEVSTPPMCDATDATRFVTQQLATTLDYSHGNKLVTLFSIWLNHQAAHHLLPGISHYHFADERFVKAFDEWRKEHNLPFHYEHEFSKVVKMHLNWITKLSGGVTSPIKAD